MVAGGRSAAGTPRTGFAYLDAVLDDAPSGGRGVLAMAHRGGASHPDLTGLENTLAAFRHAADLGYRYLETDVHATADDVLVAAHDAVLQRVAGRPDAIAAMSAADLAAVRTSGGHAIPTLEHLLEELPSCRFNIDLKAPGAVRPLAHLLQRTGAGARVCVGSFSQTSLREFRTLTGGKVATSATPAEVVPFVGPGVVDAVPLFSEVATVARRLALGALSGGDRPVALQVPHRRGPVPVVTATLVRRAHAAGLHVHVWTVDDPEEMEQLLDLGVDGLITDRTDVLRDVLVGRGLWRHPS